MDIKTLQNMVQSALSALDSFEGGTDSKTNGVFDKIRAAADICIENNDLHPFLKENIELTKQYTFKQVVFSLYRLNALTGGVRGNPSIREYLSFMSATYDSIINKQPHNKEDKNNNVTQSNKIFIVHGHDEQAKIETARFIEKAGLEAIILHEQPSGSRTIIEKIESFGDVGFAVILYTPCDVGAKKSETLELAERARQNVVFEHGYFIGRLGRSRVAALVKGEIETPNDISGIVYTLIDNSGAWKMALFKELEDAGYIVNTKALR
ncbi:putative nucleotide-binding protein [Aeromonas caviae]|uniref:TIR domain-containing protein n=1 Tax=Aeromonas caviae TaxID=648 RepID=UPI00209F45CF|nr:nucleotide-binding protein [Aeromonas caviae]MCP1601275.1 putative nucleotide-binding protein [Aeromonas caviae]